MKEVVTLYFDGGCSPNPGPGRWGAHATFKHRIHLRHVCKWNACVGDITNNGAEYLGLIGGIRSLLSKLHAEEINPKDVELHIKGDSKLVINQLEGNFDVRSERLMPLYEIARKLFNDFRSVRLYHIAREQNRLADALARSATLEEKNIRRYDTSKSIELDFSAHDSPVQATNDMYSGKNDDCYIDANFLYSLTEDKMHFEYMDGEEPLTVLKGPSGSHSILGRTAILKCSVGFTERGRRVQWKNTLDFLVVDSLPSKVHIAVANDHFEDEEWESDMVFWFMDD